MKKKQFILGFMLVLALMVFAGCSSTDDATDVNPGTPDTVMDNTDMNNGTDTLRDDADNMVDNAGDVIDDMVTSDGAMNNDQMDNGTNNL